MMLKLISHQVSDRKGKGGGLGDPGIWKIWLIVKDLNIITTYLCRKYTDKKDIFHFLFVNHALSLYFVLHNNH
jgi:hypothetical protein